jgi:hypothetical protein
VLLAVAHYGVRLRSGTRFCCCENSYICIAHTLAARRVKRLERKCWGQFGGSIDNSSVTGDARLHTAAGLPLEAAYGKLGEGLEIGSALLYSPDPLMGGDRCQAVTKLAAAE